MVTLHHFTNPAWFSESGGWLRRDAPRLFARYVECVGCRLAPEVRYWLTINEPTVLVMQGYVNGAWPPFTGLALGDARLPQPGAGARSGLPGSIAAGRTAWSASPTAHRRSRPATRRRGATARQHGSGSGSSIAPSP